MANLLLLPDPTVLALVSVEVNEEAKLIIATAKTTSKEAQCPLCQQVAHRVHSTYVRSLADLPCSGQRVLWLVQVRRFWCANTACKRVIFTERLSACAPAHARRTEKQATVLCEVAFALGGKAGERIANLLSMETSHDTLLRLTQRSEPPVVTAPRMLGLDDFAWKKGYRWGTLLIDLEAHKVVDVLPDREAETVEKWLEAHPGVEVISRDRAGAYAEGASKGAPHARQIADRFHLLVNLHSAMVRLFERKHELLKQVVTQEQAQNQGAVSQCSESGMSEEGESKPLTPTEVQRQARRTRRKNRYEEVIKLHEQGISQPSLKKLKAKAQPAGLLQLEEALHEKIPERHLLDVVVRMERLTGFGRHLGPLSGNEPKMDDALTRQLLALFAYGTNLGPHQMARHLRGTLDADQIAHINRRHITAEKLDAALRDVKNCFNRYTLPHYWGEEKRAASDGTQYELAEENLLAEKHIRYGGFRGIAYHHVSDMISCHSLILLGVGCMR